MKPLAIYIHVPFCTSKCFYCDFNSSLESNECINEYFEALKKQTMDYSKDFIGYEVSSVFIGGGTPTVVDSEVMSDYMEVFAACFNISYSCEYTIESNPASFDVEKLNAYKKNGVNRISIGLQSSNDKILNRLGRIHSYYDFLQSFKDAKKAGFKNINIDLMFGIPGQTYEEWVDTIDKVSEMEASHISCYSLKIEEGTYFCRLLDSGKIKQSSDELDRRMYRYAINRLIEKGYVHYEISNFSLPGNECRHNLIYWKRGDYLGIGAGAHSCISNKRFHSVENTHKFNEVIMSGQYNYIIDEVINTESAMKEYMMLGLRLINGVSIKEFKLTFEVDVFDVFSEQIEHLCKKELLKYDSNYIYLSSSGLDLANQVFCEFV